MRVVRVAVTGGRDHKISPGESRQFVDILRAQKLNSDFVILIHGGASGVDREAAEIAEGAGFPPVPIYAPWEELKGLLGDLRDSRWKAAGSIRNKQVLRASDFLVAFPGGSGTRDCVRQAQLLGKRVKFIAPSE